MRNSKSEFKRWPADELAIRLSMALECGHVSTYHCTPRDALERAVYRYWDIRVQSCHICAGIHSQLERTQQLFSARCGSLISYPSLQKEADDAQSKKR